MDGVFRMKNLLDSITHLPSVCELRLLLDFRVHLRHV